MIKNQFSTLTPVGTRLYLKLISDIETIFCDNGYYHRLNNDISAQSINHIALSISTSLNKTARAYQKKETMNE